MFVIRLDRVWFRMLWCGVVLDDLIGPRAVNRARRWPVGLVTSFPPLQGHFIVLSIRFLQPPHPKIGFFCSKQFFSNAFLRARGLWCPMMLDQDFGGSFLLIVYCGVFSCRVEGSRVFQLVSQRALKKTIYLQITYLQQMGSKLPLPLLRKRCRLSRRLL